MKEPVSSLRKTDSLLLIYFGSNRTEWKIIWISGRWSTDLDWWYTIGKHAYQQLKAMKPIMDDNFYA
jgi:hypothetical protein